MKLLNKKVIGALFIALSFGVVTYAETTAYCIRVYCEKDTTKKLKKADDTSIIISATYDSDVQAYLLGSMEYSSLNAKCGGKAFLWGTNAERFESVTQWVPVHPVTPFVSRDLKYNPNCARLR